MKAFISCTKAHSGQQNPMGLLTFEIVASSDNLATICKVFEVSDWTKARFMIDITRHGVNLRRVAERGMKSFIFGPVTKKGSSRLTKIRGQRQDKNEPVLLDCWPVFGLTLVQATADITRGWIYLPIPDEADRRSVIQHIRIAKEPEQVTDVVVHDHNLSRKEINYNTAMHRLKGAQGCLNDAIVDFNATSGSMVVVTQEQPGGEVSLRIDI